jgi:hypothetical protein
VTPADVDALLRIQDQAHRAGGSLARSWPPRTAMDAAELGDFLERSRYGVLAIADGDHPIAGPALFTVIGASFWFASVERVRPDHVLRTRWASLVVIDGEPGEHRAVAADGALTIIDQPPARRLGAWRERHGRGEDCSGMFLSSRRGAYSLSSPARARSTTDALRVDRPAAFREAHLSITWLPSCR